MAEPTARKSRGGRAKSVQPAHFPTFLQNAITIVQGETSSEKVSSATWESMAAKRPARNLGTVTPANNPTSAVRDAPLPTDPYV